MDLPRYQSHKTVGALQIANVSGTVITFVDEAFPPMHVDPSMFLRYTPTAGDYYVAYDDGYTSFSPQKAFEEGYSLITPPKPVVAQAQAGYTTAGLLGAILLCAVCTLSFARGNPAALAKYRAEKAAAGKTAPAGGYKVPSAGKWSKPSGSPAPVNGK